jgi:hypothetical protein
VSERIKEEKAARRKSLARDKNIASATQSFLAVKPESYKKDKS